MELAISIIIALVISRAGYCLANSVYGTFRVAFIKTIFVYQTGISAYSIYNNALVKTIAFIMRIVFAVFRSYAGADARLVYRNARFFSVAVRVRFI